MPQTTTYAMSYGWPLYYIILEGPNGISLARKGKKIEIWIADPKQSDGQVEIFHFSNSRQQVNVYARRQDTFWYLTALPTDITEVEQGYWLDYLSGQESFILETYKNYYAFKDHYELCKQQMLHNIFRTGGDVRASEFLDMLRNCKFVKNNTPDELDLPAAWPDWYVINRCCRAMFWNYYKGVLEPQPRKQLTLLATRLDAALNEEDQFALGIGYRAGSLNKDQFWRLLRGEILDKDLSSDTKSWLTSHDAQWSFAGNSYSQNPKPKVEEEMQKVLAILNDRITERWPTFVPGYGKFLG